MCQVDNVHEITVLGYIARLAFGLSPKPLLLVAFGAEAGLR